MIQIYSPKNTNYEMNGDMTLSPTLCDVDSKLGDTWTLEITHPIDEEGRWKHIEKEAVLSVPTFMGENQLYRIDKITDKSDTEISAKAYPVFFDSADDCFLMDTRPTDKNGQEALDAMTSGTKYSGESDITTVNTAYFVRRNLMDAINGESPSFIEKWGGEPLYNNFKIIINERAGGDYGAEVRYGKNMIGVNATEDMSEVVTRIVPVAYNGRTLSTNYVDSPLVNNYAKIYTREIVFENIRHIDDADENTESEEYIICSTQEELDAALAEKCKEQFEAGIDLFKVSISVEMAALENTEEYKDFKDLVKIGLGDTVGCCNSRLDITTKARAIQIKWDCITDTAKEIILGDYKYNILNEWSSTAKKIENIINKDGTVTAEKVKGILNGINTMIKIQSSSAKKVDGRVFMIEDLDEESPFYGCMIAGTQGIQISKKRTADGRGWDFTTAMTAEGIAAGVIITGILSDKLGKNFWNLDTGELNLNGTFKQETDEGLKSVEIRDNKIMFYAWNDNGNYVGKVSAVKETNSGNVGIEMSCDNDDFLVIGYEREPDENGKVYGEPVIKIDKSCAESTPWIKNTASGTMFKNNPSGGIIIENGLVKDWAMLSVSDKTLPIVVGISSLSGNITKVTYADVVIKDGLITSWTTRTEEH